MDSTGKSLLNLMFNNDETICVSHNQYAYHSVPLEKALDGEITLVPVPKDEPIEKWQRRFEYVDSSKMLLVSLNPINGFRSDANSYKYRSFLVEMDTGSMGEQIAYIKKSGLPYSALIFSGNKSLHVLITLLNDVPNEKLWRKLSEWTLNILALADPNTKNPSRCIRIPGAERDPGKYQTLLEIKSRIDPKDFITWLNRHPNSEPKEAVKRLVSGTTPDYGKLKPWAQNVLKYGLDPNKGRNKQWFSIACEMALANFSLDDTIDILSQHFTPDKDFKEREWKTTIKSGFKHIYDTRK